MGLRSMRHEITTGYVMANPEKKKTEPEATRGRPVVEGLARRSGRSCHQAAGRRAQPTRTKEAQGRGEARLNCAVFFSRRGGHARILLIGAHQEDRRLLVQGTF